MKNIVDPLNFLGLHELHFTAKFNAKTSLKYKRETLRVRYRPKSFGGTSQKIDLAHILLIGRP